MRFDHAGEPLSVPASASLDLTRAMTLMAWIKPSESQSGWHTILARQTDAYFLAAGGGRQDASRLAQLDQLRFLLVILLIASVSVALAGGHAPWGTGSWRWVWLATLFVAGALVDAALAPSDTLIAPALVALGCGAALSRLDDKVAMYGVAAVFAAVTFMSVSEPGVLPLPHSDGGVVRSAAFGLVLVLAGLLSARRGSASGALGRRVVAVPAQHARQSAQLDDRLPAEIPRSGEQGEPRAPVGASLNQAGDDDERERQQCCAEHRRHQPGVRDRGDREADQQRQRGERERRRGQEPRRLERRSVALRSARRSSRGTYARAADIRPAS